MQKYDRDDYKELYFEKFSITNHFNESNTKNSLEYSLDLESYSQTERLKNQMVGMQVAQGKTIKAYNDALIRESQKEAQSSKNFNAPEKSSNKNNIDMEISIPVVETYIYNAK